MRFRREPTYQCTRRLQKQILRFWTQNFQTRQNIVIWNPLFTLQLQILWKPWTCSFDRDTITQKLTSPFKVSVETKSHLANEGSCVAFFSRDVDYIFWSSVGNDNRVLLGAKRPHKPVNAHEISRIKSLTIYTKMIEYKIVGDTMSPLLRYFSFISKLNLGTI